MKITRYFKAFALTGRLADCYYTQGDCPGLGASALSGRLGLTCETSVELLNRINQDGISVFQPLKQRGRSLIQ